jgi:UDP:flavonoid glycosyltransferase YjiC (YdhE family)
MRTLIASTAGSGHFGPLVPFADALIARGDDVLQVVPPELADRVAHAPHRIGASGPASFWDGFDARPRDEQALLGNREWFGRLCTAAMRPAMEAAFDAFGPDLVLRDPCEFASAIAAEARGIPHAAVACSRSDVEWTSLDLIAPVLPEGLERALRAAPYLTRFAPTLDPPQFPDTRRYREPAPASRSGGRAIYATFGSVAAGRVGAAPYRALLDAVATLDRPVLLTTGGDVELGPTPAHVTVERWVPQAEALARAALVVCHGGSGTVLGALAAGLPLVLTPMFSDQFPNAEAIAAAGAGLVSDAAGLRNAIETVLAAPSYRAAAARIADELRAAPDPLSVLGDAR